MKDEWYRAWRARELRSTPEQRRAERRTERLLLVGSLAFIAVLIGGMLI